MGIIDSCGFIRYLLLLALVAISPALAAAEVNLYSARQEALIKPLLDRFTAKTGIVGNLVSGEPDALLQRLKSEGKNSPADLFLTTDVGRLLRAQEMGLLQAVDSAVLREAIPAQYRDPGGHWFGISLRARVIVYAKDRIKPEELSTYEALSEPKWKGKLCVRSSSHVYNQSLVAAMIAHLGIEQTERWAHGLVANLARPPEGGDRDQIKAVAAGQCDLAIVNTYYLGGLLNSTDAKEREAAAKVGLFWPDQHSLGTHINISGVGVTKAAQHHDNALRLLEFLLSDESQRWYAETNFEYPVKTGVAISDTLQAWGVFVPDKLNLSLLGKHNAEALRLLDRVGWR
ncbi:MAG TPA: Fe(3+) ABC transporter substrate-binding protein [Gammaproteobacteria bacterium]|nr:Fe(3+) ABC transporter substrate-binding protein [Gammaproteobacteria bacterium]